ncbi:hypothetical protein N657DRAFT_490220 [Parathielavia appendiculata]|uniref:Uncharacterized protein n=1 Tax=Parathielavia appendiculata TaxID=2587402 RepID=A0AAN6TYC9_9PEZI|nr:hypothetical protein N657DRAFT_490220 [Parathielavia appendiculata]
MLSNVRSTFKNSHYLDYILEICYFRMEYIGNVELNSQSAQIHHNDTVPDIASYHGTMSLYKGVIPLGGLERTISVPTRKGHSEAP